MRVLQLLIGTWSATYSILSVSAEQKQKQQHKSLRASHRGLQAGVIGCEDNEMCVEEQSGFHQSQDDGGCDGIWRPFVVTGPTHNNCSPDYGKHGCVCVPQNQPQPVKSYVIESRGAGTVNSFQKFATGADPSIEWHVSIVAFPGFTGGLDDIKRF